MVSQEQLDQAKQHMPEVADDAVAPSIEEGHMAGASGSPTNGTGESSMSTTGNELAATPTTRKKKQVKKKLGPVDEKAISPRPSYWPLALAFSLAVVLAGAISSLIVLGIGVLFVVVSIIGWGLERR